MLAPGIIADLRAGDECAGLYYAESRMRCENPAPVQIKTVVRAFRYDRMRSNSDNVAQ
jgi:hypothetical protein